MKTTLLISHIPKTAGTSLRSLVAKNAPDATFVYNGELALGSPNIDYLQNFRSRPAPSVVMGHFSYGVHRFLGVRPRYATLLRSPIERVVSLYLHLRIADQTALGDRLRAGLSLADFVECGQTEQSNNHMCRCIAGIPPESGLVINAGWLLDLALHNLALHYEVVGTLDNSDQAIQGFVKVLDWKDASLPKLNVATDVTPELDDRTLRIIRAFNELDTQLYDNVRNRH